MMSEQFDFFEDYRGLLEEVISKYLPNYQAFISRIPPDTNSKNATIYPRTLNSILTKSKYEVDGINMFIHYTSLENAINIIKERSFRMYSLDNMDDPSEMKAFLGKENIDPTLYERFKSNLWCLSFCKYEVEQLNKSLPMWKEYTRELCGCGIVFSIYPDLNSNFNKYLLIKACYENDENLKAEIQEYLKKREIKIGNWIEFIAFFSLMYKNEIYRYENEIRLLYIPEMRLDDMFSNEFPIEKLKEWAIDRDFKKKKSVSYHQVSIDIDKAEKKAHEDAPVHAIKDSSFKDNYDKERERILSHTPIFKIEKILLGPNIKENQKKEFENVALPYLNKCYANHKIEIEYSNIKKYFIP